MNPAEEYILQKPEPYQAMLMHLRSDIERRVPLVGLKYRYRIPFYCLDGRPFCYFSQTKDYVDVGFWNTAHLTVHLE